jgi:putative tryptophan/tyrosine transport system substrate-binding protein
VAEGTVTHEKTAGGRGKLILRREIIAFFGAAAAWPRIVRAQQGETKRLRVGVLMSTAESDPGEKEAVAAFVAALGARGWVEGKNLEIVYRWGAGDARRMEDNARAIVATAPDVILVKGANLPAAKAATSTIPLVFEMLSDATAQAYVTNFAHPGGNVTGFASDELALVGKRLELLRELVPAVTRVLYITSKQVGAGATDLLARAGKDAAATGVTFIDGSVGSSAEIAPAVENFAREQHGGILTAFNAFTTVHRAEIIALAQRFGLPAIYPFPAFAAGGGLISYGFDQDDQFRQAGDYVARILAGEKPGDLPVQEPTRFRLVINTKTAKALGLAVPPTLLVRADEVIE